MRALLLHNPAAGFGQPNAGEIRKALVRAGYRVDQKTKGDAPAIAAGFAEMPDLVVVAGGDGSVGALLDVLAGLAMPVAIVPLGTANNIARSLGIDGDPLDIIAGLATARRKRLDVGIVGGEWGCRLFLESVGFGVLSRMMSRRISGATREHTLAMVRKRLVAMIRKADPAPVTFVVDGAAVEEECLFAEITSISRVGPSLALLHDRHSGDRALDAVVLPAGARQEMIDWLGHESGPPPLTVRQGRFISATCDGLPFRIDDRKMPRSKTRPARVFARLLGTPIEVLVPVGMSAGDRPDPSAHRIMSPPIPGVARYETAGAVAPAAGVGKGGAD